MKTLLAILALAMLAAGCEPDYRSPRLEEPGFVESFDLTAEELRKQVQDAHGCSRFYSGLDSFIRREGTGTFYAPSDLTAWEKKAFLLECLSSYSSHKTEKAPAFYSVQEDYCRGIAERTTEYKLHVCSGMNINVEGQISVHGDGKCGINGYVRPWTREHMEYWCGAPPRD